MRFLPFTIEPGDPRVVVFNDGGRRPATNTECQLWDALETDTTKTEQTDEDSQWASGVTSMLNQLRHMPERQQVRVFTEGLSANPQLRAAVLGELFGLGRKEREVFWAELPAPVTGHIAGLKNELRAAEAARASAVDPGELEHLREAARLWRWYCEPSEIRTQFDWAPVRAWYDRDQKRAAPVAEEPGDFGSDPEDSAELLKLRQAIDKWLPFATDGARELGDYVGAVMHVGVTLAEHPEWRESFPRDTGWDQLPPLEPAAAQPSPAQEPEPDRVAEAWRHLEYLDKHDDTSSTEPELMRATLNTAVAALIALTRHHLQQRKDSNGAAIVDSRVAELARAAAGVQERHE